MSMRSELLYAAIGLREGRCGRTLAISPVMTIFSVLGAPTVGENFSLLVSLNAA